LNVWRDPLIPLRAPLLFDLHADPFERAQHEAGDYVHWYVDRMYAMIPAQAFVQKWLSSFKEYPPRQKAASFSLDKVMQQLTMPPQGSN